jgi:peptide chain release factor 1
VQQFELKVLNRFIASNIVIAILIRFYSRSDLHELVTLLEGGLDVTNHVEGSLGVVITLTVHELTEGLNGGGEVDELAGNTGEHFSDSEGLGEELLNLSSSGDDESILFRELIHTKNGNDILEGLVVLDKLLDGSGGVVVSITDNGRIEDSGGGLERVDSGVDGLLSEGTGQHSVSIQMREGGGGSGISEIISRHVHSLHRGNGTVLGGGNSLLKSTEISSESGLVADSGRNTTEQGRHLGTGLGESEDVVDEKEHILTLLISEVLSDGETSKSDSSSGTWGLVHLTVHKGASGASAVVAIKLDDTGLNHLVIKIVTLSSSLTDTGENGVTTVSLSDVVNELHDQDSLADTSTTEKTNLTTLLVRGEEVDDLDTYEENGKLIKLIRARRDSGEAIQTAIVPPICDLQRSTYQ